MFLHELKSPKGSRKRRKTVGRGSGSGHGKTSCRGQKGQMCRSGRGIIRGLEGGQMPLIRRIPKVGFRSKRPISYQVVNLENLSKVKENTTIDAAFLKKQGLIKRVEKPIKILGNGTISKVLNFKVCSVSKSAQEKIEKAGGRVEAMTCQDSLSEKK